MKKLIIAFVLVIFSTISCSAFEPNAYWQIRLTLKEYNKALSGQDLNKVKEFYDENYKSSDNFTLEELAQMLEKTFNAYGKMKQKTKINNITVFDDYAIVQLTDTTKAIVHPDKAKVKEKQGVLNGKSVYILYFKKIDGKWKIYYDDILAESTSLKYGYANKIPMELYAPSLIKNGQQYDLSLKMNKPEEIVALASLANEEIQYPTPEHKEKFRKVPPTGELERVVKANNNNKSEYAIASIGLTKVSVNEEETKARIEVIGMAYLMKRINMIHPKENNEK